MNLFLLIFLVLPCVATLLLIWPCLLMAAWSENIPRPPQPD